MRFKIALDHFRQFHLEAFGIARVAAHRLNKFLEGKTDRLNEGQGFGRALDAGSGHDIGRDFDRRCLTNFSDDDNFPAARFQN